LGDFILRQTFLARLVLASLLLVSGGCDYFVSPETRVERAEKYLAQGEHRRALLELKNALKQKPGLDHGRLLLAQTALWLGDPASAERELQLVPATVDPAQRNDLALRIDLSQRRFQKVLDVPGLAPLYRGLALQGLGRVADAEQAFREATRDSTAAPALHIEAEMGVAESLAAQQSLPQALELTRHVTTEHADSALAWFVHGALLARSNLAEADKALLRARALAPGQLDVMRQIALVATHADVQLALHDVAGAKDSSAALNRLAGGSPLAVLIGARVSMSGNDYVAAAADLRRLVNSVPNFVQARFLLGVVLMTQGSLEQASNELGQVVKLAPGNLEARQLLAQVRLRLEDPDGALRVLVPALQANAADESLAALVGAASAQRGGGKHAPELLERALKEAPDNHALQLQLASAYLQAGDADKALELLRRTENAGADVRRQALLLGAIVKAEGPASAERQIEKMLAANPGDASLLNLAAAWYVGAQNADRARALLGDALARAPRQTALLFTLAQLEARTQHPEAATAALERLLAIDPGHTPARLALAQLALARGDRQAAKTQLETLRAKDKRAVDARLMLARIALGSDDTRAAAQLVEEALAGSDDAARTRADAGLLYLEAARYEQASAHFREGTTADPSNAALWLQLGRAQLGLDQLDAARESLQRALTLRPGWLPAEGAIIFLELQNGNRVVADQRITKLRETRPKDPEVLLLEGEVRAALGQYGESVKAFAAVAQLRPSSDVTARLYKARVAAKDAQAEETLESWLREHPDDLPLHVMVAEAYARADLPRKAAEHYEAVVARRPDHAPSLNNLAWLYFEAKDERALATARRANAASPESAAISDTLGWILVESGQTAEGLTHLKRAAQAPLADPEIDYHLAAALAKNGEPAEALVKLNNLLKSKREFSSRQAAERLRDDLSKGPS
jgi:cellulose synthase operon protein C